MIKLKWIFILIVIYLVFYLSVRFDINILYPYYFVKDLFLYPVNALVKSDEINLSNEMIKGINNSLEDEIKELKKLTNIDLVLSEFDYVNATIISRNREYWFNNLLINKGKSDGIKKDDIVIDSDGLIGRISDVYPHSSEVKLITSNDIKNKISVEISSNNKKIYGITREYNYEDNYLEVVLLTHDEVDKNSIVYTTGMGGVFPKGIIVGKVDSVIKDSDKVSLIAKVSLSCNIEGDHYVRVLQRKEVSNN